MPINIMLRTSGSTSPFRNHLLQLCSMPHGDELILCSGFFQEVRGGYRILSDQLLAAIQQSGQISKVELYGCMNSWSWPARYAAFRRRLTRAQFQVRAFQARNHQWHAKIAMRLVNGKPIAAIIGSSNLTRPPFGIAPMPSWNYECDVTIWDNQAALNEVFRPEEAITDRENFLIAAELAAGVTQPDELSRLTELLATLRNSSNQFKSV